MKEYKVSNLITAASAENVRLGGYVAELMNQFFSERIFSDYAKNVVYRECEDGFINRLDDSLEENIGYWQGEFWGKWIISACRAARYAKNDDIKEFIHRGALRLTELQREDGYLGTYKDSGNFMAPPAEIMHGKPCWNWNIWCRKYTLWGMLEAYMLTDDERLLSSSVRMADHLMSELNEKGRHIAETGTFKGMPSCSIMKPMLILYRFTEDERYLNFCLSIADRWENPEIMPALIANALEEKPLTAWYPNSDKWAKAYEMMSCYDGLIELYRVTGCEKYLRATVCFFDILMKHEKNILSSVAFNDVFGDAAYDLNCITEPCDIIHLMRLCHELFALTGDMKYMDAFEEAFCNPFLAGVFRDGKWGARGVRGAGRHLVAIKQAYFTKNHCCVNNMPRGFINMAESCVMLDSESVYVLLYTPSETAISRGGHTIHVSVSGDYLADSAAQIRVDFGTSPIRSVRLRIPAWTKTARVSLDGREYTPAAGCFTLTAEKNVAEITVQFDNSVAVLPIVSDPERGDLPWKAVRFANKGAPMGEVEAERFISGSRFLLRKGVMLLCRSKLIGNTEEEMFGGSVLSSDSLCALERVRTDSEVNLEYDLRISDGKTLRVCDFASGANRMFDDMRSFSIYF